MKARTLDKLRVVGLGIGWAMTLHNLPWHKAERWLHNERVRKAIKKTRPGR
jgi:hypothetical protein